mmetsp:Transcript_516/g.1452  ORF Transcript_516/g.1452 Transcript_516/m.1452 type:complete len:334 (-) Transcript_516:398-1399(-)
MIPTTCFRVASACPPADRTRCLGWRRYSNWRRHLKGPKTTATRRADAFDVAAVIRVTIDRAEQVDGTTVDIIILLLRFVDATEGPGCGSNQVPVASNVNGFTALDFVGITLREPHHATHGDEDTKREQDGLLGREPSKLPVENPTTHHTHKNPERLEHWNVVQSVPAREAAIQPIDLQRHGHSHCQKHKVGREVPQEEAPRVQPIHEQLHCRLCKQDRLSTHNSRQRRVREAMKLHVLLAVQVRVLEFDDLHVPDGDKEEHHRRHNERRVVREPLRGVEVEQLVDRKQTVFVGCEGNAHDAARHDRHGGNQITARDLFTQHHGREEHIGNQRR